MSPAFKAKTFRKKVDLPDTPRVKKPRGRSKLAHEFREVVKQLLEKNIGNVERWLREVGEGSVKKGLPPDPAKALDLLTKLAEFAAPKLQRTEVTPSGHEHGPPVTQIAITFVDGRAPSASMLPALEAPVHEVPVLAALPSAGPLTAPRKRVRRPADKARSTPGD